VWIVHVVNGRRKVENETTTDDEGGFSSRILLSDGRMGRVETIHLVASCTGYVATLIRDLVVRTR